MEFSQMSRAEQLAQLQELRTEYEAAKAKDLTFFASTPTEKTGGCSMSWRKTALSTAVQSFKVAATALPMRRNCKKKTLIRVFFCYAVYCKYCSHKNSVSTFFRP